MKEKKWKIASLSFFDRQGIVEQLESMAQKGWMLEEAGDLIWTYRKIPPRRLRFAVTYFPQASPLDPSPGSRQREREELCLQDGWQIAARWGVVQIFFTEKEDAVPIDTDPVTQVSVIRRAINKKVLPVRLLLLFLLFCYLALWLFQMDRDLVGFLSGYRLFYVCALLPLMALIFYDLGYYLWWERRAEKGAQEGIFIPIRTARWSWWLVGLSLLFFLAGLASSGSQLLPLLCGSLFAVFLVFSARRFSRWLRAKGLPSLANRILTAIALLLVACVANALLAWGLLGGWISLPGEGDPVDSYQEGGLTWQVYDDPLPLEVEDLVEIQGSWSKQREVQGNFLLAYGSYRQDVRRDYPQPLRELSYELIQVHLPCLYGPVKESLIEDRQDKVQGDAVFVNHYEPSDPSVWKAEEAYQLHWSDGILDTYLVCWPNRIVEITFYWPPTREQLEKAGQLLSTAPLLP